MTTYAINTKAKKDKKKSMRIAMVVHGLAALLLLIPIASQIDLTKEPAMTQVVLVDFNDFKAASAKSSTKAGAAEAVKEAVKEPVVKEKPAAAAEPTPEKPKDPVKAAPVAATKEPTKIKTKPTRKPAPPKSKPAPTKAPTKTTSKKAPTKVATTLGTPGKEGTGTKGTSTTGDAKTDGKVDKGQQGMDFEGDALFARRVIRRAEIKQLSKQKGTIVINLCVNQNGSVVYADFNKADSNIYDASLVKEAVQATYKYRFEPDYTAPAKQCGKLTYIIKIK